MLIRLAVVFLSFFLVQIIAETKKKKHSNFKLRPAWGGEQTGWFDAEGLPTSIKINDEWVLPRGGTMEWLMTKGYVPDAENKNKPLEVNSEQKEVIDIKGDDFEIEEIVLDEDAKEASDDVFTSSISADSEINQVVLKDDVKNQKNNLMIVLVLLFLITAVAGIIFFISRKKKNEKPVFSSEINNNQQIEPDVIDNLSREDKNSF